METSDHFKNGATPKSQTSRKFIKYKMKKIIFSLIAVMTFVLQSQAQDKKGYIGLSIGPSIPMGDLASKDADNDAAGWANTGAIFDISFAYKLGNGNFGISALLRGQSNPTDAQSLADELANQVAGVNWTVESAGWGIGGLMFGGFGSFPISEKSSFDSRAMIGFLSATSPEITITGSGPGGTVWVKQSSTASTSFAYLLGAGFKFDLGKKLYLLTNLDYLGSNPEFKNVETTASDGTREKNTWSQSMGTINLSVGIALKL
jgi:hypothetical protein